MRVEEELLLHCAYPHPDRGRDDRIKVLYRNSMDWSYLIRIAHFHGLIPLLYKSLSAIHPEDIPEWVLEKLRQHFLINARRNILLTEELLRLLSLFKDEGISAIPYKGPTLAVLAYGDICLRQFGDLDILIQSQDFLRAKNILISLGYEPEIELSPSGEKAFINSQRDFKFSNKPMMANLELQWRIAPVSFPFSVDLDSLRQRLYPVHIGDREIETFRPEDLILILCIHGLYHFWERLEWVCDLAQVVRTFNSVNWNGLFADGRRLGAERVLLFGLLLTERLFKGVLPNEILIRIENDRVLKSLVDQRCRTFFNGKAESLKVLRGFVSNLKIWRSMAGRINYCLNLAFTPNTKDIMFFPLPAFLFPLYSLIRPVRLTAEYGAEFSHCIRNKGGSIKNFPPDFTNQLYKPN